MSQLTHDVLIALIAGLPALILAVIAWRKAPGEMEAAQADADRAQNEATQSIAEGAKTLADSLRDEVDDLNKKLFEAESRADMAESRSESASRLVIELQQRVTNTEARLAQSESRTADAEKKAHEFRTELIRVGTMFDHFRREQQRMTDELVLIIQTLVKQVEKLGGQLEVDLSVLTRITDINSNRGAVWKG